MRLSRLVLAAAVAISICAWIAVSNHCAFSALSAKTETVECPFHSKPAKKKESPSNLQCCKVLRAIVASVARSWERDHNNFADVDLSIEQAVVCQDSHNSAPLLLDTGPPGKTSFAESIGSVCAHAPPLFA